MKTNRRSFIRNSLASATGLTAMSMFPQEIFSHGLISANPLLRIIFRAKVMTGMKAHKLPYILLDSFRGYLINHTADPGIPVD